MTIVTLPHSGLVNMERDADDARWLCYSLDEEALAELNDVYGACVNPERIELRRQTCEPQGSMVSITNMVLEKA